MNPETTLKELLKPPFSYKKHGVVSNGNDETVLIVSPMLRSDEKHSSADGEDWIISALNEKAAREWDERKRWELHKFETRPYGINYICPKCGYSHSYKCSCYCPSCGERLDPPEGSDG